MKRASDNVVEKSKKLKPETSQGGLGIILSVTLKNFMCHDHLQFDFDPHVNFIVGQNGSGKSAVMIGIILALGGKSSVTGRYSNIHDFVKIGKNTAHVSVTLKNCGPYAYKPEKYGDKIIVEREISSEGNSGKYKLKNSSGKIESTLKEELKNILIAMDIQIDNPVLVLTQDTSRNFLMAKTGKEGKLFEFFYRGTGLQKLEIEYQQSIAMNEDSAKDLAAKKQALDHTEKEVKRLEKLRKSDEQLDELKRESFWAKVILLEKELETEKDKKEELLEKIDSAKKEAEESKNKHDEMTLEHDKFKQERAEIEEKIVTERKSYSELDIQLDTCAGKVRSCKGEVELYKREEKKLLADIRDIEATINEHQRKDQTDYENEKRQRNEEIQKLEEKLSNVDIQKDELETEQFRFIQEQSSQEQELQRLKAEIGDLKSKRNMRHYQYSRVKDSKNNRQIMFGEHTPSVLQEIQQNQRKFRKMPKGPIGLDIEVKDSRWTSAVEACIKPHMLRSFCADNSDDSRLLTQILQKYYTDRMPSVIISPFLSHMHNVSQHQAQTNDFPTVLDMLTIKDPVIANCLIDQLSIENIILIEDITTAQNVMLDNPPAKCYSAFLLNCDEILLNPYRYYSASRRPTNVLSRNIDESYLPKLQEEIETIDIEIKNERKCND
nr:structural maintenance of chromosomes protein 6 isoform X2 [Parasteatoda tepidariorum]